MGTSGQRGTLHFKCDFKFQYNFASSLSSPFLVLQLCTSVLLLCVAEREGERKARQTVTGKLLMLSHNVDKSIFKNCTFLQFTADNHALYISAHAQTISKC